MQIAERTKSLEHIKKSSLNPLDMSENKLHFAFLFSSPLVRDINGSLADVMKLDWNTEIEDILDALKKINCKVNYKINVATRGISQK